MAKIDVSKIEGYEAMSAEDKVKLLESFEYDDGASEIERYKNAASKANSEAAEWKKKHNAQLSEDEKKKQETADYIAMLEKQNKELLEKETIATYKAELLKIGYSEELADATAKALVSGDIAKAIKNQASFVDAQKKAVLADAVKETPIPPVGNEGPKTLTKEEFSKMSLDEQMKVYTDTPDLYNELTKK
jgi:regulator of RNase E activity RraB